MGCGSSSRLKTEAELTPTPSPSDCGACQGISPKLNKRRRTQDKMVAHDAKVFLITCMDFRLLDDINETMKDKGYDRNYDQYIVAGASLGFVQEKYSYWGKAALDHLEIGMNLHHLRKIIFIDHLDCGAYKKFYPEMHGEEEEIKLHEKNMQKAHDFFKVNFPNMKFHGYILTS
jgi:carbonic anhydrase